MVKLQEDVLQSQNNMGISMKPVLEMAEHTDIFLVASEDCKSNDHASKKYAALMDALGFQVKVTVDALEVDNSSDFNYTYTWGGKKETDSYEPLKQFLRTKNIFAEIVGSGNGLPGGLLYNVDIYTLKPYKNISSVALSETNQAPRLIFKLKGRTDLVVLRKENDVICNMNIKYFIEIKTVKDFNDKTSLKEAILQLIGGNVGSLYHSPPVLLTNLQGIHYVFNIIQVDDVDFNKYSLKTAKFNTFGEALSYVEAMTATLRNVTRDFARMPTPRPSVSSNNNNEENDLGKNELIDTFEDFDF